MIDNVQFARENWDALVKCIGSESGEYTVLIGAPDAPLQKKWADEGLNTPAKVSKSETGHRACPLFREPGSCPPGSRGTDPGPSRPQGIVGLGSLGPPGAAQAVRDKGLQDKICVVGTALPTHAAPFIKDGSLDEGLFWKSERCRLRPGLAGKTGPGRP